MPGNMVLFSGVIYAVYRASVKTIKRQLWGVRLHIKKRRNRENM